MAAAAKSRQVLECLMLLNSPTQIEKLKSESQCRESVLTLLRAKIEKPLLSIKNDSNILEYSLNAALASEHHDLELHHMIKTFIRANYFPPEDFWKIFCPDQKEESIKEEDCEPESKKTRLSTFWDHSKLFTNPKPCLIMMTQMFEAYKSELETKKLSQPFMDLIKLAGISHISYLADISLDHLNLINEFVKIFNKAAVSTVLFYR